MVSGGGEREAVNNPASQCISSLFYLLSLVFKSAEALSRLNPTFTVESTFLLILTCLLYLLMTFLQENLFGSFPPGKALGTSVLEQEVLLIPYPQRQAERNRGGPDQTPSTCKRKQTHVSLGFIFKPPFWITLQPHCLVCMEA